MSAESGDDRLDRNWASGNFEEALSIGRELAAERRTDADLREKLALLAIDYARRNPPENQIPIALQWLSETLALQPERMSALELRANLLVVMGHQSIQHNIEGMALFQQALVDFIHLLTIVGDEAHEKKGYWQLEAARTSFLIEKNRTDGTPDYELAAKLYALTDTEAYDSSDWFFRGMANLDLGGKQGDEDRLRVAAACFLRSIEEDAFVREGRYFAAHTILLLEEPTDEEFNQATHVVKEMLSMPSKEFLIDALVERLILKAKLTGRDVPEL